MRAISDGIQTVTQGQTNNPSCGDACSRRINGDNAINIIDITIFLVEVGVVSQCLLPGANAPQPRQMYYQIDR